MDKPNKTEVKVDVESWAPWWMLLVIAVLCYGDPDLLDVLAEFCRRYMENPNE